MHPNDRDPDMAAAAGVVVGLGISLGGVALLALVAWLGAPVARYAMWATATMVETMR